MTTGAMLASGIEPCARRPNRRIFRLSAAEVMAPAPPARSPPDPPLMATGLFECDSAQSTLSEVAREQA
jgi:hypothetical protein